MATFTTSAARTMAASDKARDTATSCQGSKTDVYEAAVRKPAVDGQGNAICFTAERTSAGLAIDKATWGEALAHALAVVKSEAELAELCDEFNHLVNKAAARLDVVTQDLTAEQAETLGRIVHAARAAAPAVSPAEPAPVPPAAPDYPALFAAFSTLASGTLAAWNKVGHAMRVSLFCLHRVSGVDATTFLTGTKAYRLELMTKHEPASAALAAELAAVLPAPAAEPKAETKPAAPKAEKKPAAPKAKKATSAAQDVKADMPAAESKPAAPALDREALLAKVRELKVPGFGLAHRWTAETMAKKIDGFVPPAPKAPKAKKPVKPAADLAGRTADELVAALAAKLAGNADAEAALALLRDAIATVKAAA